MDKSNKIPIKNIYYMALYAWDKVKDISTVSEKSMEKFVDINNVIVELFLNEVQYLLLKGTYKDYINTVEESKFIKGKIQLNETIRLVHPNMVCSFDEYSENIIYNRIIKTVLLRIYSLGTILDEHREKSRKLLVHFSEVDRTNISYLNIDRIEFNRFNKDYERAIGLGLLLYKNTIPSEEKGKYKFLDLADNEYQMSKIFEEFLRQFYNIHSDFKVRRSYYFYDWDPIGASNPNILPRMETDIELTSADQKIIIDAKYYKNAFSSKYEVRKLIPENIYQMQTYLIQNLNENKKLRGILLYPCNGYHINERFYCKLGFTMEFQTVDLNMGWEDIKSKLLEIIRVC